MNTSGKMAEDDDATRARKLKRIFCGMAVVQVVTNFDGGAVPAALLEIRDTFDLDPVSLGLVGSLVYEGIAIGSLLAGPLLSTVSPRRCTQITLMLNTAATLLFGLSTSTSMLLTFRFFIGLLQAVPAVYFPVWVDEFAPAASATVWMATIQGTAPFGILIGYLVAGAASAGKGGCPPGDLGCGWRAPFIAQSVLLIFISCSAFLVPAHLYDLRTPAKTPSDPESGAAAGGAGEARPRATTKQAGGAEEEGAERVGAVARAALAELILPPEHDATGRAASDSADGGAAGPTAGHAHAAQAEGARVSIVDGRLRSDTASMASRTSRASSIASHVSSSLVGALQPLSAVSVRLAVAEQCAHPHRPNLPGPPANSQSRVVSVVAWACLMWCGGVVSWLAARARAVQMRLARRPRACFGRLPRLPRLACLARAGWRTWAEHGFGHDALDENAPTVRPPLLQRAPAPLVRGYASTLRRSILSFAATKPLPAAHPRQRRHIPSPACHRPPCLPPPPLPATAPLLLFHSSAGRSTCSRLATCPR